MTELEKRIKNFNVSYGTKLTVDRLDNALQKKSEYIDKLFLDKKNKNAEWKNYVAGLIQTLDESIKSKIKINNQADYDVSNINLVSFIQEYEAIMQERKDETEYGKDRTPYAGESYKGLVQYLVDSTKEYDQALCWIWAEDVVNEKLSINDMKAVTDRAIADLDGLNAEDEFGEQERDKLANVYWSMKAMEMVRQQRGIFFKIFSFRINGREKEYFNQLVAAKDRFIAKGFPVAELQKVAYKSVMKDFYEDVEKGFKSQQQVQDNKQQKSEKLLNLPKMVESIQPFTQDVMLKDKAVEEIVKNLPQCRWEKQLQKTMLNATIMGALIKTAQETNKAFDEGVARGENPHDLMIYQVKTVFQEAFLFTGSLGYMDMNPEKKILAAQVMTDVIMKHYSPVVIDNKSYAEFAQGYMFKDLDAFKEVTGLDSNSGYFEDAKKSYNELQREAIHSPELNPIINEPVVAPVEPVSSINNPSIIK